MRHTNKYPILDEDIVLDPNDTIRILSEAEKVWTLHYTNQACYSWFFDTNCSSLLNKIRDHPAPIILDIGCSSGISTSNLKYLLPEKRVIGVDISEEHIRQASGRFHDCEFLVGNGLYMSELGLSDPVAAIFAYNSIGILADVYPNSQIGDHFMKSALQALDRDGFVAVLGDYVDWFIAQKRNDQNPQLTLVDSQLAFNWRASMTYERFGSTLQISEEGLRIVGRPETQGDKFA